MWHCVEPLEWISAAFDSAVRYVQNDPEGRVTERGIFTATLTSVISSNPTLPHTSTLRVTEAPEAMLNGTVITCSDQLNPMNITLILAGKYNNNLDVLCVR